MLQTVFSLELIRRHKQIIFFLFCVFFFRESFGRAQTECSGERYTVGPNLIPFFVCMQF